MQDLSRIEESLRNSRTQISFFHGDSQTVTSAIPVPEAGKDETCKNGAGEDAAGKLRRYVYQDAACRIEVTDRYTRSGSGFVLRRCIKGRSNAEQGKAGEQGRTGVKVSLWLPLIHSEGNRYRVCIPSMVYSTDQEYCPGTASCTTSFMEDRLTGPLVMAYNSGSHAYVYISKDTAAVKAGVMRREAGDTRYLQDTDVTSLGFCVDQDGQFSFRTDWPYSECDKSAALSADERPAEAFYPLDGNDFAFEFVYSLGTGMDVSFSRAAYTTYEGLAETRRKQGEEPVRLPCSKQESREYRIESLGRSYRTFEEKGAGFFFHFDPYKGYGSRPTGFSTCYDTIPHNSYTHILEYGFTGRQINAAYIMASERGGEWIERGEKVIDFFLDKCQKENGWVYSLFDLETGEPFCSFGDPDAPKLHYISKTTDKGNYLRTMTEPMNDLLDCYEWYREKGREHAQWLLCAMKYAGFLVRVQNEDGSWYRAYKPDGEGADPLGQFDLSTAEKAARQKTVTSIPLIFLCHLCRILDGLGKESGPFREAAERAGDYVRGDMVRAEHYQGATLDNPNQVDKEAAQYVMAGLYSLYEYTHDDRYLTGAENAAFVFTTWNYLWNAPTQPGTILDEKGFKTMGMGAINSVWGGGVVDIYSLFHIRELALIGKRRSHPFMEETAERIAAATAQIMSRPDDGMGFADIGMQPEGFGICPQGIDEGMIQKGDIWGTLGWIYSAGIYGLNNYLLIKED